jgi:hypothetical protein
MKKIIYLIVICIVLQSCVKEITLPDFGNIPTQTNKGNTIPTCSGKRTTSVQCSGTTQSGSRCKNNTLSCNGKCYLHGGN